MKLPSQLPCQKPMPRVGMTVKDKRPLFTSMTSTPSDTPPFRRVFVIDQPPPHPAAARGPNTDGFTENSST